MMRTGSDLALVAVILVIGGFVWVAIRLGTGQPILRGANWLAPPEFHEEEAYFPPATTP